MVGESPVLKRVLLFSISVFLLLLIAPFYAHAVAQDTSEITSSKTSVMSSVFSASKPASDSTVISSPTTLTIAPGQESTGKKILDWIIEAIVKYSFRVLGGILILFVGWIIAKFICRLAHDFFLKHKVDVTVTKFLVATIRLVVMAFAVLIALGKFGIEIAPFIAGLSVVGFGTSFALQGPLSNYAAGASLIFTKPFKVGDIIEVVGEIGEVEDMTLPRTLLRTLDDTVVVIPNKHIIGEIIHNYSGQKKIDVKVGVGYKTNVEKAIELIRKIINNDNRILHPNNVKVGILEFADSSINLYARIWCKQAEYWDVLFDINKHIFEEFKKNNIEIPFPQRDIHIHEVNG